MTQLERESIAKQIMCAYDEEIVPAPHENGIPCIQSTPGDPHFVEDCKHADRWARRRQSFEKTVRHILEVVT